MPGAERFVRADWQSAGIAGPVVDLAFPSVRVIPAGGRVHARVVEPARQWLADLR